MLILFPLLKVFDAILDLVWYALITYIILGYLEAFDIVNRYNKIVHSIHNVLFRLLEPMLTRIRRFLPDLGGIDLSPIPLFLMITFFKGVISEIAVRYIG